MKTVRFLSLALAFMLLAAVQVHANGDAAVEQKLRDKVVQLIKNVDLSPLDYLEEDATIRFVITNENKLVLLSVHTRSNFLDSYLKNRLNYEHVNIAGVKKMTPYNLSIRFVK